MRVTMRDRTNYFSAQFFHWINTTLSPPM